MNLCSVLIIVASLVVIATVSPIICKKCPKEVMSKIVWWWLAPVGIGMLASALLVWWIEEENWGLVSLPVVVGVLSWCIWATFNREKRLRAVASMAMVILGVLGLILTSKVAVQGDLTVRIAEESVQVFEGQLQGVSANLTERIDDVRIAVLGLMPTTDNLTITESWIRHQPGGVYDIHVLLENRGEKTAKNCRIEIELVNSPEETLYLGGALLTPENINPGSRAHCWIVRGTARTCEAGTSWSVWVITENTKTCAEKGIRVKTDSVEYPLATGDHTLRLKMGAENMKLRPQDFVLHVFKNTPPELEFWPPQETQ